MKHILLSLICLLPVSEIILSAQSARMFTVTSGLISSQVDGIFQDGENSIWITSGYGLTRYDGSNFEHFHHEEGNPFSLSSDNAHFILEDTRGTVWVGTEHGLDIYDPDNNSFSPVRIPFPDPDVTWLIEGNVTESGSKIYCSVLSQGMCVVDAVTHKPDTVLTRALEGVLGTGRGPVLLDSSGLLWKEKPGEGLKAFDTKSSAEVAVSWAPDAVVFNDRFGISALVEDPVSFDIYIATHSNGLFVLDRSTLTVSRIAGSDGVGMIETMEMQRQSGGVASRRLYIGTEENGLRVFDLDEGMYISDGTARFPYCSDNMKIHDIFIDHQGNMWLAAYYSGVVMIPESMYGFASYKLGRDASANINEAPVTTVVEYPSDGHIYVGTDGAGLFRMDTGGVFTPFNASNSGLTNDSIKELIVDRRGKMWVGTYLGGLMTYTVMDGFRDFSGKGDIPSPRIWTMVYDPYTDILYVSTLGGGLYLVDTSRECVVASVPELSRRWARTLYLDRNGKVWIGTDNGVVYFDPTAGEVMDYEVYAPWDDRQVYAFCESRDGTLWIGYRMGVVELDRSSHVVRTWTEEDGLYCEVVKDILEGPDGDIWISTLNGLSKLDPKTGRIINFHEYDGLPGSEFYSGSAYMGSDNRMYFGAMDGLASFYPHLVNMKSHRLSGVHVSNLTMMNSPVRYDPQAGKDNLLDAHVYRAALIHIPRRCNVVSFGFSTPEYSDPQRVRYDCLMTRCDKDWRSTDNGRMVSYTNLRPGKHLLRMKAYFEGDEENYAYNEIVVKVQAPWYLTAWAFLLYILVLSSLIAALSVWRKRRLKAERDRIRLDMFSNITQEIRTPLFLVLSPLKKLRESETDPLLKDTLDLMYRNGQRISRIVNQITDLKQLDAKSQEIEEDADDIGMTASEEDTSAKDAKGKKRIVAVDPDPDTRRFIRSTFRDYNVEAFEDGDTAWGAITTERVDAVIMDLHLRGIDGYALCRKIRRNPMTSHIPLIVLTSVDDEGSEQLCSDLGADRFFIKPVSTDLLRSGVAQAISARESVRMKLMNADAHDYDSVSVTPFDEKLKARILQAVNANYSSPDFGVEELSRMVGISRVHLNRKLKAIMGISPSILLKNTRLKQAAFLLVENSQPNISEIAYKVGFSGQSYFSAAFHEYFGMTPTEFALQYGGGNRDRVDHLFE